jgi:hypothetical protein
MFIHKITETCRPACGQKQKAGSRSESKLSGVSKWLFKPILAPMLKSRWLVLILTGLGAGQLALTASGLGGWRCPINAALDVPCPGCGMTTAITLLLKEDWVGALRVHAFAPLGVLVLVLMAVAGIIPGNYQRKLSAGIASLERHTGIFTIGLISMVVYWLLRLIEVI